MMFKLNDIIPDYVQKECKLTYLEKTMLKTLFENAISKIDNEEDVKQFMHQMQSIFYKLLQDKFEKNIEDTFNMLVIK